MPSLTHSDGSITSMSVISPCLLIGHIRSYTPPNSVVILVASRWFIPLVVSTLRKKCSFGLIPLVGWNIMNFIIFFSPPSNTSKMTIIQRFHSWLVVYLPLWKMMEFVSWDDYIFPTEWKIIKTMFQTTNQILYMAKSWFAELKNGGPFHSYRTVYQPDRNFGVPPAVYPTGMAQWPPSPLTHFSTLHDLDAGWGWVTG